MSSFTFIPATGDPRSATCGSDLTVDSGELSFPIGAAGKATFRMSVTDAAGNESEAREYEIPACSAQGVLGVCWQP